MTLPHDFTDLYLAPVTLAVDARVQALGALTRDELAMRVAIDANGLDINDVTRSDGLLHTVTHLIELHGWTVSWDDRGIRIAHNEHSFVLGAPTVFGEYRHGAIAQGPGRHLEVIGQFTDANQRAPGR